MRVLTLILLAVWPAIIFAQKEVTLSIRHGINGEPLELGKVWQHPYGAFSVYRLQYYLSDIVIIHDGGQEKSMKGLYLLVDADQTDYVLGDVEVGEIEGIRFNIGVDSATNHADPALWPADHPLAYQEPSMHWGWTSGYRFMAFEGLFDYNKNGDPEKVWEFHAVGDKLLTPISISVPSGAEGKSVTLEVKADYDRLFDNGVHIDNILHGDGTLVQEMMENFNKGPVFHGAALVSSSKEQFLQEVDILALGNPARGSVRLRVSLPEGIDADLTIIDLAGNTVFSKMDGLMDGSEVDASGLHPGYYVARLATSQGAGVQRSLVVVE